MLSTVVVVQLLITVWGGSLRVNIYVNIITITILIITILPLLRDFSHLRWVLECNHSDRRGITLYPFFILIAHDFPVLALQSAGRY